jgi:hypothetical protein
MEFIQSILDLPSEVNQVSPVLFGPGCYDLAPIISFPSRALLHHLLYLT